MAVMLFCLNISPACAAEILIRYESSIAWKERGTQITITPEGEYTYKRIDMKTGQGIETAVGFLSDAQLDELAEFAVKDNKFFTLPQDLTTLCFDGADEYLEINFEGKNHKTGGNCVQEEHFLAIRQKLEQLKNNILEQKIRE